jgi:hypothetical protein
MIADNDAHCKHSSCDPLIPNREKTGDPHGAGGASAFWYRVAKPGKLRF